MEREGVVTRKEEIAISYGTWDENVSWEFLIDKDEPDKELCTGVCCIVTFQNKFILIKNKRGWEFPGGKVEKSESLPDAVIRETREEVGAIIENPKVFGYKKLTAKNPVNRINSEEFYPFPHSFIVFFHAEASVVLPINLHDECQEIAFVNYENAQKLLSAGRQYENVLEYLLKNKEVSVK